MFNKIIASMESLEDLEFYVNKEYLKISTQYSMHLIDKVTFNKLLHDINNLIQKTCIFSQDESIINFVKERRAHLRKV